MVGRAAVPTLGAKDTGGAAGPGQEPEGFQS